VGGTNPSLLEAMASKALVAAHDNPFNRSILADDALYFSSAGEVADIIGGYIRDGRESMMINKNLTKIKEQFSWDEIIKKYDTFILDCVRK
jgi:glycosyltransferase involved in cell wall biosynthesis